MWFIDLPCYFYPSCTIHTGSMLAVTLLLILNVYTYAQELSWFWSHIYNIRMSISIGMVWMSLFFFLNLICAYIYIYTWVSIPSTCLSLTLFGSCAYDLCQESLVSKFHICLVTVWCQHETKLYPQVVCMHSSHLFAQ